MAKYIIETDDENPVELNGQELYRVKGGPWMALSDNDLDKLEPVEEGFPVHVAGYSAGVRDAVEAARKIERMKEDEAVRCFGVVPGRVLTEVEPLDIVRMLKKYEQDTEIRVGDEVALSGPSGRTSGVVTYVGDRLLTVMYSDGMMTNVIEYKARTDIRKTGKHFDQVEALLAGMQP